jgi:ABC-type nickel/cobalt efflux system permease component RcnA
MKLASVRPGVAAVLLIIALGALVLWRVASESRAELAAADAYRHDDRLALAVEHYRRAIRWSLPMSSNTAQAVSALESIAAELEVDGDLAAALLAWRSVSGGLAATRFLYSGTNPAREKANDQIARLVATDRSAAIDASLSTEQLAADHRRLLDGEVSPDPWWGALLLLGMATWVGALVLLAWRGFDSAGRFRWAGARGPIWGALVGLVSFALGLLFA